MRASILFSTHNRVALFRRTLWALALDPPNCEYEVIVVDDGSTEDLLGEVQLYSSAFPYKFIRWNRQKFTEETGVDIFFNCPAATQNVGFRHSKGELIFLQGQEVLPWGPTYKIMLSEIPEGNQWILYSKTYDIPRSIVIRLDHHGSNLSPADIEYSCRTPLHTQSYRSDVVNYLSLMPRTVWAGVGGFDERYLQGISAEDSDFIRRARANGVETSFSSAISFHQSHGGKTCYYEPDPGVISQERFDEGCRINRRLFDSWAGEVLNGQGWDWGILGVEDVVSNV